MSRDLSPDVESSLSEIEKNTRSIAESLAKLVEHLSTPVVALSEPASGAAPDPSALCTCRHQRAAHVLEIGACVRGFCACNNFHPVVAQ